MFRALFAAFVLLAEVGVSHGEGAKTDLPHDPSPPEVVARLGTIPLRDTLAALTLSQDGKRLFAYTTCDDEIRVWDTVSGRLVRRKKLIGFPHHGDWFGAFDVSPDGATVAHLDARMLYLLDTATGKQRTRLPAEEYSLLLVYSPDGKTLALRRRDRDGWNLILWDIEQKELRQVLKSAADFDFPEQGVVFAPDGRRLVGIDDEERLHLWDAATGEKLAQKRILRGSKKASDRLFEPIFSPDGRLLAATIGRPKDKYTFEPKGVSLIEAASGEEIVHLNNSAFDDLAFTPESRGLVLTDSKDLCVWDTSTGERLQQIAWPRNIPDGDEKKVRYLAVLPSGKAITVLRQGELLVWDLTAATRTVRPQTADLGRDELDALWADLTADARRAYRAVHKLTATPAQAVSLLSDHLLPTAEDAKRAEKLVADLDNDSFTVRETASRELVRMHGRIEPILRGASQRHLSLEARRRLEAVLAQRKRPALEELRTHRAIAALERIGTQEARQVLEKLAFGAEARETQDAKAALEQLKRFSN